MTRSLVVIALTFTFGTIAPCQPTPEPVPVCPETGLLPLPAAKPTPDYVTVSCLRLAAAPEKYDGKYIRVTGYLRVAMEGDEWAINLYPLRELLEYNEHIDSIVLERASASKLLPDHKSGWLHFDRERVIVEGRFVAGPEERVCGQLKEIERIDQMKPGGLIFNRK